MEKTEIFDIIIENTLEILPDLEGDKIQSGDSLKELGANSIDRSEIVMMTLETMELDIPLVATSGASNIGELVDILYDKQ